MNFSARLLEWLFAPFIFLWVAGVAVAFWNARATVDTALDDRLEVATLILAEEWQRQGALAGDIGEHFPSPTARHWLAVHSRHPIQYAIYADGGDPQHAAGTPLTGSPALQALRGRLHETPVALDELRPGLQGAATLKGHNAELDDGQMRVMQLRIPVASHAEPGRFAQHLLVVAQSRERHAGLLRTIMLHEALAQTAILIVAICLMWFSFNHVVRPVARLQAHLDARRADDLSPLPREHAPEEIAPLVTAVNDLMQRLQASLLAQKRFIANAAHQLRTPIAALRMHGELLQQLPDGPERTQALGRLVATGERASRLAIQLLTLARAESAATTGEARPVDLNRLCEEIAHDVVETALAREIDFGLVLAPQPVCVTGDATLLGELVRNLVDNAFKYAPAGGTVQLTVLAGPPQVVVEDSGPGVPEAERERVFAPFTRVAHADGATGQGVGGTGLGLAIVREVAGAHGAAVRIGTSEWGGASFTVSFAQASVRAA
ncbi:HAMP domain-containing protein [Corticibacter populi]|uniref:histidine kinase n=1 Tax=Corticibacter populi TaxID=1550736 RepID=A0A3M6QS02_9BURK|nr:ATP-binding protein [Corticibacter populi]RMX05763.1 HAMP domain-containing protein [Corticibacter populi]RZS30933.1 signal transduction histidine kinase [Corticibacter populi]